ncbi:MAG: hypothetical protein FWD62_14420 [Betaproteobacteria bacterium]|nr:hypothetical protein [Betaproteobacteria bacterium]
MDIALLIAVVAIPLWLNVKATLSIARDTFSEQPQKIVQILFVWLVPLVGAVVVLGVYRREEIPPGTYPAEKDMDDDFGHLDRTIKEAMDGD